MVQEGLYGATHDPNGTAYGIFGGYPVSVAGKTGTAEKYVQLPPGYLGLQDWDRQLRDQAWFCGYGPTDASGALAGEDPLVVCALIENGGHGGEVAAPAALAGLLPVLGRPGSRPARRGVLGLMATRPTVLSAPSADSRRRVGAEIGEYLRQLDYLLLAAVAGLVAYGLWIVQTVTRDDVPGDPGYYVLRQAIFVVVGVAAFAATTAINPELYRRYRHLLYGVVLTLMVIVFVVGPSVRGSRRWIDLGSFQLQPSELGKFVMIVFIAGFLANRVKQLSTPGTVLGAVALSALPIILVFLEPDFGTALVYCVALARVPVLLRRALAVARRARRACGRSRGAPCCGRFPRPVSRS